MFAGKTSRPNLYNQSRLIRTPLFNHFCLARHYSRTLIMPPLDYLHILFNSHNFCANYSGSTVYPGPSFDNQCWILLVTIQNSSHKVHICLGRIEQVWLCSRHLLIQPLTIRTISLDTLHWLPVLKYTLNSEDCLIREKKHCLIRSKITAYFLSN